MRISCRVLLCVSLLLLGITPDFTGCRIFALFGEDSPAQGNSLYTPPAIPETLEQERPAVQARINELSQALEAKDVEKAAELCTNQDNYRKAFQKTPDKMPLLGSSVKSAKLTMVGFYNQNGIRIGELALEVASKTFTISIVKVDGKWFFQDL